jgi:hypothetical protein
MLGYDQPVMLDFTMKGEKNAHLFNADIDTLFENFLKNRYLEVKFFLEILIYKDRLCEDGFYNVHNVRNAFDGFAMLLLSFYFLKRK